MTPLRVIDAGVVGAVSSQALWHGIASGMAPDAPVTLSLCRPEQAYVSIGYHRRLDEVDADACGAEDLPVLRRRIGGGPVLIDADQLFFQLTMPVRVAPAGVERLYAMALEPAVQAFRTLGLDARIDGLNDIVVGARKISGTGAGQIGEAVVVVGNVIFAFDHERMARVLSVPSARMREECLRLMRRHVASLRDEGFAHVTADAAAAALRDAYAEAFGGSVEDAEPTAAEHAAIARWEQRLVDPEWLRGPAQPARRGRRVKVRSDVFVVHGEDGGVSVTASVVGDEIERAWIGAAHLNGAAAQLEQAVLGDVVHSGALAARLRPLGPDGQRVLAALTPGLEARW